MEGLRDGGYTVHAAAAIWLERSLSGIQPGREDLRIELSEGFAARGRVIDGADGTALTGASVTVKRGLWGRPTPEKSSDSGPGGRFEIKGLAWGDERLVLEASHPAYPGERASVEVREDLRSDQVVLRLFHAEPLSGRVLDPAGKPIESARVGCTIAGVESFRTGEDGAFVLFVPRSARNYDGFEVAATHAASGSGRVVVEKPAEGLSWPKVSVVLRPGSDLRGKVKDSSGRPVSRATVRASRLPGKGQQGRGAPETAYSGDDGGYVFRRLEEGTYRLEAEALGYARAALEGVEVNETNQDQDMVLEPGRKLAGRVVDQDGQAVSVAEV